MQVFDKWVVLLLTVISSTFGSASGFLSSFPWFNTGHTFSNSNAFHSSSSHHSSYGSSSSSSHLPSTTCQQTDYSADLQLSIDPTGYPIDAITLELQASSDLFNCLVREIVLPDSPVVPVDEVLRQATVVDTCPSTSVELWSFVRYNAKCWIIKNFQEFVNITVCGTTLCQKCQDSFSGYGLGSQSMCFKTFQTFSVWAFCEGLTLGSQISRERIILPIACTCKTCNNQSHYWWKK